MALDDVKTILMPRQALLKKLDPIRRVTVPAVRVLLEPYQREYQRLIIQNRLDARLDIKGVLKIYKYFHLIKLQPTWPSWLRFHLGVLVKYASPIVCLDALFSVCPSSIQKYASPPTILQLPSRSARSASP